MCPSSCNHLLWLTGATWVGPFHRWRVFWVAWFPRMLASSIEHLQLHQFCRWYAALSLFCIRDIPTSLHWLNWAVPGSQIVRRKGARNVRRVEKGKRNRCSCYTTASRLMNSKPLCLSHLEIDRCYDTYHFSLTFLFIFQLISPLHEYLFCTSPTSTPITFLMSISPCEQYLLICWVTPSDQAREWAALRLRGSIPEFYSLADPGKGPGGPEPPPPLFLDETKARGAEKNFLETCHSPPPPVIS